MLGDYFNTRFTLQRNVQDGRKTFYATVANRVAGHIQPVSGTYQQNTMGQYKVTHMLFTEYPDVRVGDNLICEGILYKAYGVQVHNWRTGKRHVEVMLESAGVVTKPTVVAVATLPAEYVVNT